VKSGGGGGSLRWLEPVSEDEGALVEEFEDKAEGLDSIAARRRIGECARSSFSDSASLPSPYPDLSGRHSPIWSHPFLEPVTSSCWLIV
jgi:hypothetical protein